MLKYFPDSREASAVDAATKVIDVFVRQIRTDPRIRLAQINDEELLKQLRKEAAHADSIEAFCLQIPVNL